jgi:hypothetical protein
MRDLAAISLNVDACVLRARISAQWALERQLRRFREDLASTSPTTPIGNDPAGVAREAQLVETLLSAAAHAAADGDALLGADIERAACDLRAWYRLDDP